MYYAESEEKYGLARHAMLIYDRATKAVDIDIKPKIFNIYIKKATEYVLTTTLCHHCKSPYLPPRPNKDPFSRGHPVEQFFRCPFPKPPTMEFLSHLPLGILELLEPDKFLKKLLHCYPINT